MRRKDVASLLRNIERPLDRTSTIGVATSIGGDGQTINSQNTVDGEIRDLHIALPYGISSSGIDGVRTQIITNDNINNTVVGVIDKHRPPVRSGCIILYDKSGIRIVLNGDGTIMMYGDVYVNGQSINELFDRIEALETKINKSL